MRGGLPGGFAATLSIQAVRHDIGRRAATTTITARPVRTVATDPAPDDPAGTAPPPVSGGGGTAAGATAPDMQHVVRQVAAAHPDALRNSCQEHGGSWEFMDRVVSALRALDTRWGYNLKRGGPELSPDAIAWYRGDGDPNYSTDVAIVDIIGDHCGSNPRPAWTDQTWKTAAAGSIGRWKFPR